MVRLNAVQSRWTYMNILVIFPTNCTLLLLKLYDKYSTVNKLVNYYFAHGSDGKVFWWVCLYMCVCLSVYLSVRQDISGITSTIFTIFLCMLPMDVAQSSRRVTKSQGKGQFWGFSYPLTVHCNKFAAKGIIWSPITLCSRRDHSVTAAFVANGIGQEGVNGRDVVSVSTSRSRDGLET